MPNSHTPFHKTTHLGDTDNDYPGCKWVSLRFSDLYITEALDGTRCYWSNLPLAAEHAIKYHQSCIMPNGYKLERHECEEAIIHFKQIWSGLPHTNGAQYEALDRLHVEWHERTKGKAK